MNVRGAAATPEPPGLPAAVRAALLPLAKAGQTIRYRDLAVLVPVPPPHAIHKLTLALEALVREDHAAGRPLIAALALSRVGEGTPGRGFFQLLAELGRYAGPDRGTLAAEAHAAELAAALRYWGDVSGVSSRPGSGLHSLRYRGAEEGEKRSWPGSIATRRP